MPDPESAEPASVTDIDELQRFRGIERLRNHWSRPIGPRSYYWYLTFEQCPQLGLLAAACQSAIAFPYYDLVSVQGLHLTLDRIAFDGDISLAQLGEIEVAARIICREISPFGVTIGRLSGTPGAIGFTAFPVQPLAALRNALRKATLSVYPGAPAGASRFHPHVTIAYANSDGIPAAEVIPVVEQLNPIADADVTIHDAALVLLERDRRAYTWQVVSRIPLRQGGEHLRAGRATPEPSVRHGARRDALRALVSGGDRRGCFLVLVWRSTAQSPGGVLRAALRGLTDSCTSPPQSRW